ncbi:hypothetical protein FH972_015331 [Carpinus fangiana]|uniref:Uncharacterized protein n=1 Tax=Carpinus fangiana TaxID=176857 RepID=A0A5N6RFW2_9ROSI|nr:hypothetical protein FH972_015331 [Carpinus fangiana]
MGIVRRLLAEDVMKIAKAMLIQNHVFGLSHQETIDVELACLLLAYAEKVAKQEHDEGSRLLSLCDFLSSKTGSPVQRTIIMVKGIEDLNKDIFQTMSDEAVAVYSHVLLNHMLRKPVSLESLLRVLRDLNPCVMVIIEADANHNSPDFLCHFNDALLSYTAYFKCLEVCMDESVPNRLRMEDTYLSKQISNIVEMEGVERIFFWQSCW